MDRQLVHAAFCNAVVCVLDEVLGPQWTADPSVRDTPKRVGETWADELLAGYNEDPAEHLASWLPAPSDKMVVVGPIGFTSICEHHFLPFTGRAYIGYVPHHRLGGLSKFARVLHGYARRLQLQERLGHQVASTIETQLEPQGTGVVLIARHQCMCIRGVEEDNAWTATNDLRGLFLHAGQAREEFFQTIARLESAARSGG